jgi:hypothetical protein
LSIRRRRQPTAPRPAVPETQLAAIALRGRLRQARSLPLPRVREVACIVSIKSLKQLIVHVFRRPTVASMDRRQATRIWQVR